jgi:hypothetical protein
MNAIRFSDRRAGVSLVELLVAMTLDLQVKRLDARAVSRAPVNLFMSEARMVETGSGVVAATASSVTLRIPVAMGVVCGTSGTGTVLSLMPVDSLILASAAFSGHAYRQASGVYAYAEGTTTVSANASSTCSNESITTVTGGTQVFVTPQMAAAEVGTVAFLYQRVRYDFAASSALSGRVGLWRTLEATGVTEELAAPFDASSRFRYYRFDQDTVDTNVPTLSQIRGIRLELTGASERFRFGKSTSETSRLQTGVFFMNRLN